MNPSQQPLDPRSTDDRISAENKAMGLYSDPTARKRKIEQALEALKRNGRIVIPLVVLTVFIGGGTATAFITRTPNVATPFLSKEFLEKTNSPIATNGLSNDAATNGANSDSSTSGNSSQPDKKSSSTSGSTSGTLNKTSPSSSASGSASTAPKPAAPVTPKPAAPSVPAPSVPADPANIAGWGMPAWRDEFDGNVVNTAKWNVRDRSDLGLLFDAAVPDRNQVSQSSGLLSIQGAWLPTPVQRPAGQDGIPTLTHKTGYLDQRYLNPGNASYTQRWGRWEIRAKTPTGPHTLGSLAAFWLRNSNSGEIDIMEAWGYNNVAAPGGQRINTATTTVHTQTSGSGNQKYFWHHADYQTVKTVPWDGFHTYAFELMPTYAKIIVDGKTLVTVTPASHPNLWNTQYFNSPFHVRLNLHIGPSVTYWGIPDVNNKAATQPLNYQVDYVRIYKP